MPLHAFGACIILLHLLVGVHFVSSAGCIRRGMHRWCLANVGTWIRGRVDLDVQHFQGLRESTPDALLLQTIYH